MVMDIRIPTRGSVVAVSCVVRLWLLLVAVHDQTLPLVAKCHPILMSALISLCYSTDVEFLDTQEV